MLYVHMDAYFRSDVMLILMRGTDITVAVYLTYVDHLLLHSTVQCIFVFVLLLPTLILVSNMHLIVVPITRSFLRALTSSSIEMNLRLFRIQATYAPKPKTRIFRFCFFFLPAPCRPLRSFT